MSRLPCDIGRHRFPGPIHHFYPALTSGANKRSRTVRLCADHAAEIRENLAPYLELPEGSEGWLNYGLNAWLCMACGQPTASDDDKFYCTAYPKGDREDYFGSYHVLCRPPQWVEDLAAGST